MKKILLYFVAFQLLTASANAACLTEIGENRWKGKRIRDLFSASERKLSSELTFSFVLRSEIKLSATEEEELYYAALGAVDDRLESGTCKKELRRIYFLFPKTALTIATKDLDRIRKFKNRPEWQAHAMLRSQVSDD